SGLKLSSVCEACKVWSKAHLPDGGRFATRHYTSGPQRAMARGRTLDRVNAVTFAGGRSAIAASGELAIGRPPQAPGLNLAKALCLAKALRAKPSGMAVTEAWAASSGTLSHLCHICRARPWLRQRIKTGAATVLAFRRGVRKGSEPVRAADAQAGPD